MASLEQVRPDIGIHFEKELREYDFLGRVGERQIGIVGGLGYSLCNHVLLLVGKKEGNGIEAFFLLERSRDEAVSRGDRRDMCCSMPCRYPGTIGIMGTLSGGEHG